MHGPPATDEVPAAQAVQAVTAPPADDMPAAHGAHVPLMRMAFGEHMGSGLAEGEGEGEGNGAKGCGAPARPRNSVLGPAVASCVTAQPVLQAAETE